MVKDAATYSRGHEYMAEEEDDEAWGALVHRDLQAALAGLYRSF